MNEIKNSLVKGLLPVRNPDSHKGQNGRVMIVGGSIDYYGAPVLAALGALYGGADLVYIFVPECNFDCTRSMYPDFIVKKYPGKFLIRENTEEIIQFGKKCDCVLLGPGLSERDEATQAVKEIILNLHIPTVLDADSIQVLKKIEKFPLGQQVVITPHMNEFCNLVDKEVKITEDDPKSVVLLRSISMDLQINVLLKGRNDYISSQEGHVDINRTGNAGMTVGGSGDVLSGLTAALLSQGLEAFDAARCAAFILGKAGDYLKKQKGYNYSASDLAFSIPYVMK